MVAKLFELVSQHYIFSGIGGGLVVVSFVLLLSLARKSDEAKMTGLLRLILGSSGRKHGPFIRLLEFMACIVCFALMGTFFTKNGVQDRLDCALSMFMVFGALFASLIFIKYGNKLDT